VTLIEFAKFVHGKPLDWWQREMIEKIASGDRVMLISRPRVSMSTTLEMGRGLCAAVEAEHK